MVVRLVRYAGGPYARHNSAIVTSTHILSLLANIISIPLSRQERKHTIVPIVPWHFRNHFRIQDMSLALSCLSLCRVSMLPARPRAVSLGLVWRNTAPRCRIPAGRVETPAQPGASRATSSQRPLGLAAGRVLGHTDPVEERGRGLRGRHVGVSRKTDGKPLASPVSCLTDPFDFTQLGSLYL